MEEIRHLARRQDEVERRLNQQPAQIDAPPRHERQPPQQYKRLAVHTRDQTPTTTAHKYPRLQTEATTQSPQSSRAEDIIAAWNQARLHTIQTGFTSFLEQGRIRADNEGYVQLSELIRAIESDHNCNIPFKAAKHLVTRQDCFDIKTVHGECAIKNKTQYKVFAISRHSRNSTEPRHATPQPQRSSSSRGCATTQQGRPEPHTPRTPYTRSRAPIGSAPTQARYASRAKQS